MISLKAEKREIKGKKVKRLLQENKIPAILYGPEIKENILLQVPEGDFLRVFREAGETTLVNLEVEGKKYLVFVHDIQKNPLNQRIIHIDFYQPNLQEEMTAEVPLVFTGEAPAVKELGGILIKNLHSLEVKGLPKSIPHEIVVDISSLKTFDDTITVADLKLPEGVKALMKQEEVVALVSEPEDIEEELESQPEENVEQVEVVKEKKEEEKEEQE